MENNPENRSRDLGFPPFRRSLSFKLGLSMGLIILVSILTFAYFSIIFQRRELMRNLEGETLLVSETLTNSMKHSMWKYDVEAIESIVRSVGRQSGVLSIRIYNHAGEVRFSTEKDEIGRIAGEKIQACYACHSESPPLQDLQPSRRTWTYGTSEEKSILGMITPIQNEATCFSAACHVHPEDTAILGVLEVGVSLEETDRAITNSMRKTIIFALLLFVGVATLLGVALVGFVAKPVNRMMEAVGQIARGDYGEKLAVSSRDELGELVRSFNVMSERIQAREEELERSREQFQTLFENVPTYIAVVDREYRIVQANRNFKSTFGDKVGEHCFKAYKDRDESCKDCPVERTFRTGEPQVSEEHGLSSEGREIYYLVYTAPIPDSQGVAQYAIEMSIDLTETKRLERELRANREFLNNLIENSIDGIVAVNPAGEVILFNRSAENILGYGAGEVIGTKGLERLFPRDFILNVQRAFEESHEAEPFTTVAQETALPSKSGEGVPVRFSGAVLLEEDSAIGAVGFFQDLRQIKMLEKEKLQAERLAVVGQTVAALAHGIKNIITGLEGGVYVMQTAMKRQDDALLHKGWGMIERNIEKISHLVKDLLSYSRVTVTEVQMVNPNEIAEEVIGLFQEKASQAGIEMATEPDDAMGEAYLDPKALHTCLTNLISNAIDACIEDEEKEYHRVVMRTRRGGARSVVFEVEDNGTGMDDETMSRLFSNFFTTKGTKGTGLGLMVTDKLVHEHGGRIIMQSEPGKGSLFCINIPQEDYENLHNETTT